MSFDIDEEENDDAEILEAYREAKKSLEPGETLFIGTLSYCDHCKRAKELLRDDMVSGKLKEIVLDTSPLAVQDAVVEAQAAGGGNGKEYTAPTFLSFSVRPVSGTSGTREARICDRVGGGCVHIPEVKKEKKV